MATITSGAGTYQTVSVQSSPAHQAFRILQFVYVVAPILAGLEGVC